MPLYSATAQQLAWLFFRWDARDPLPVTLTWVLPALTTKWMLVLGVSSKKKGELFTHRWVGCSCLLEVLLKSFPGAASLPEPEIILNISSANVPQVPFSNKNDLEHSSVLTSHP